MELRLRLQPTATRTVADVDRTRFVVAIVVNILGVLADVREKIRTFKKLT